MLNLQGERLADIVLWEPAFFGVRPHAVLKGGIRRDAAGLGDVKVGV